MKQLHITVMADAIRFGRVSNAVQVSPYGVLIHSTRLQHEQFTITKKDNRIVIPENL